MKQKYNSPQGAWKKFNFNINVYGKDKIYTIMARNQQEADEKSEIFKQRIEDGIIILK